jgi:hypothetical protein
MVQQLLRDHDFHELMILHIKEIIDLLLSKEVYFSILTNIADIKFDPVLPSEITQSFKPITLFVIAEYTYETCSFDEGNLYFEAGFGHQNVGSFVTVPLHSIVQIIIEDTPIFINLSVPPEHKPKKADVEKSTNIFLSNPENKKLLKKRR